MSGILLDIVTGFWDTLAEMAPYLLLGFLAAGLLSVFVSPELIERHLGGRSVWPVIKAAAFGVPLPLCSCGVIPVAASLRRHGASRGATTSFLVSTPQTGVDSILVTYSLLGPVFAIFRPIAALLSGLVGGVLVSAATKKEDIADAAQIESATQCEEECCSDDEKRPRLVRALRYGFLTLPQDLARALLLGLAIAGLIAALVPEDFFAGSLGQGPFAMLIMLLVGIPLYVCATGTVPVAAVLLMKGVSPGAVLVFLMSGPATNAATITTLWKVLGRKTTLIYLATVGVSALIGGVVIDSILGVSGGAVVEHLHGGAPGLFKNSSAVVLLAVLGYALVRPRRIGSAPAVTPASASAVRIAIRGMTCNGCARSVHNALRELHGVASVQVDLDEGMAVVQGTALDSSRLTRVVQGLGFDAEVTT